MKAGLRTEVPFAWPLLREVAARALAFPRAAAYLSDVANEGWSFRVAFPGGVSTVQSIYG